jgi:mRNA interferase MazF
MEIVKRGDIVLAAAPGDYGRPRPAVVIQSDFFNDTHPSVTLCLVTSHLRNAPIFRVPVAPTEENGLRERSQIMVDKVVTLPRERLREGVGRLDAQTMGRVDAAMTVFLGLA